jgi:hypothetical protein
MKVNTLAGLPAILARPLTSAAEVYEQGDPP